ncbi:MAG: cytochrome C oxidase subunit III [Bacteroidota bacterium]|nr:cytochrome C oxidase subunit III [Bacteroidota bacterium]
MAESRKNIKKQAQETTFQKIEKLHPHKLFLYLAILGSSLIFTFMLIAYTTSRPDFLILQNFYFPKAFTVSTFVLMVSSYTISKIIRFYKSDEIKQLRNYLGYTLILGLAFSISQYIGWRQLETSGIYLSGDPSGAYLYVISGFHLIHLLGGLGFLGYFFVKSIYVAKDPIKSLIMVTNPCEKLRLEMLSTYWHFMDALWVVLFFYFLFTF